MKKLGKTLFIATGAMCAVLHVATFLTMLPPWWVGPSILFLMVAVVCTRETMLQRPFRTTLSNLSLFGIAIFIYAIATFILFYKRTGGASSVAIIDGIYVAKSKANVIGTITE